MNGGNDLHGEATLDDETPLIDWERRGRKEEEEVDGLSITIVSATYVFFQVVPYPSGIQYQRHAVL